VLDARFPKSLAEFDRFFSSEEACREYILELRWPEGYRCIRCGAGDAWPTSRNLMHCRKCGYQASMTAGTIFHRTRKPLRTWFQVMWWVMGQKNGASAFGLQRILGLGSYQTAWAWLHKLRRAMIRPGRERLTGEVEVDETFVGGVEEGGGRRHVGKKAIVAIAAEIRGRGMGRIRMKRVRDSSEESLVTGFIKEAIEPGAVVVTDGLPTYRTVEKAGYVHRQKVQGGDKNAPILFPRVHRVASLLKRWLLGTHQGRVERKHLPYYLDEFVFRFNRRTSRSRGLLFYRLMQQAVALAPIPYRALVGGKGNPSP
jgi:transposase-like protein/ribosomal protein L40E